MPVLNCSKREATTKPKALRREQMGPGIIYGSHLKESVRIQASNIALSKLLKEVSVGSLVTVKVDGTPYQTMLKQVDYMPMSTIIQHVDFQVLTTGEKINTSSPVNFINKESVSSEAVIQELLAVIEYSAIPADLVEEFVVDLSTIEIGENIKVEDLAAYKDEKFSFITPGNASIVNLTYATRAKVADEDEEEATAVITSEE